ncbi:MAG: hypothetical protein EBX66_09890 [Betaproteobacteria bacterium]|nr:hypothetical protein [Betaproteobacteria bacterium]
MVQALKGRALVAMKGWSVVDVATEWLLNNSVASIGCWAWQVACLQSPLGECLDVRNYTIACDLLKVNALAVAIRY